MHVFITGGTRGIGNGVVKEFLKNGHDVSFTGTKQSSIDKAAKDLEGNYLAVVCDVRDIDSIVSACDMAFKKFGDIDIWINNAGVGQDDVLFGDLSENDIRKVVETNILGTMFGTKVAINQFIKQKKGTIYNLEGLGSNGMTIPKTIVYGSTKRLISYFTKGCKKEYKNFKFLNFYTIQPGMVFTDLLLENMSDEGMKIANILGNEVDYTARRIYKGIIKNKKKIIVTNSFVMSLRFFTNIFKKRKRHEKN